MSTYKATIRFPTGDAVITVQAPDQHAARQMIEAMYGKGSIMSGIVHRVGQRMKEKYIASEEDIASGLLEMRSSNVDSMINIWNNISSNWSIDSVSQVHVSL